MTPTKILVVDDSPTELRLVTGPLRNCGYDVVTAADGEEALEKAAQERPDLIVLDVVLPKKNGYQVCRLLKNTPDTQGVKILLLTSKNQESDRYWGLRQGADEYLAKPFAEEDLLAAIAGLL